MDVLAVVPALTPLACRRLGGQPLALHAVIEAAAARHVTRVVLVGGDDSLCRTMVEMEVAVVPAAEGGETGRATVLTHALEAISRIDGYAPVITLLLDPAYAWRTADVIDGAIAHLLRCGADSLVAVHPLEDPLWLQGESGLALPFDRGASERQFIENGSVVATRTGVLEQTGEVPAGRVVLYAVSALTALRADGETPWQHAELLQRAVSVGRATAMLRGVRLLVFDFDGVMTDNRVIVFEDGREAVLCNRSDGLGLEMVRELGLPLAVISKEGNPVVTARCRKLKIPCEQGVDDKLAVLSRLIAERDISLAEVAFMGNDINDLPCMRAVRVGIAPADAHPEVLQVANLVTTLPGGFGAVREVCDWIRAVQAAEAS